MMNKKINVFFIFFILASFALANTIEIARESYDIAKQKIELMDGQGYPTLPLMDILSNAQNNFNNKNYNYSDYLSKQVLIEAQKIIELQDKLLILTDQIETLSSFGMDITKLDIKLLYTKSDYEAANINLARTQADEISEEIRIISSNYSKGIHFSLEEYKKKLDDVNGSNSLFNEYYISMEDYYKTNDFSSFLTQYGDFEIIKQILIENSTYGNYSVLIREKNISFNRAKDMLLMISEELSLKNYGIILKNYQELNNLARLSIELHGGIKKAEEKMEQLDELGILNQQVKELYGEIINEYDLENFQDSKEDLEILNEELFKIEKDNLIFESFNKAKLKKGLKEFIIDNWVILLTMLFFIVLTFNLFKNAFLGYYHNQSLVKNNAEIDVLTSLQKSLQEQYFIEKTLDKKDYDSDFQDYENRKIELGNNVSLSKLKLRDIGNYFKKLEENIKKIPLINRVDFRGLYSKLGNLLVAGPKNTKESKAAD